MTRRRPSIRSDLSDLRDARLSLEMSANKTAEPIGEIAERLVNRLAKQTGRPNPFPDTEAAEIADEAAE